MTWFKTKKEDVLYEEPGNFKVIKTTIKKLHASYTVVNYHRNRKPDFARVRNIEEYYIQKNILRVPQEVSCWLENEVLHVYDGIHRLTAAKSIPDMIVFVKIMEGNEQKIIDDFRDINSGVNLPLLYLEENNQLKRKVYENVMEMMKEKWSPCISPSRNCQSQNYNRDVFLESILHPLEIDLTKKDIEISIFSSIIGINNIARSYVEQNKINTPKKCAYYGFWLMYLPISEIKNRIQISVLI